MSSPLGVQRIDLVRLQFIFLNRLRHGCHRHCAVFTQCFEGGHHNVMAIDLKVFTQLVYMEVVDSATGYARQQFEAGLWEILKEATAEGDEECYYLDPRDEDTWLGLRDIAQALKSADLDKFHYDHQSNVHSGQDWIRSTALPALYGDSEDWWVDHPTLNNDSNCIEQEELLLGKSRRTPYEDMILFKLQFASRVHASELRQLTREKYGQKVREVLGRA